MKYISEINAFYDWLVTNQLSPSAVCLWHALMHIANKTGWQDDYTCAISTLSEKTGLSESSIKRARNQLVQFGRIEIKPRGGNNSARYKIIPLAVHTDPQSEPQYEPQSEPQYEPQSDRINRLDKTKTNKKNNIKKVEAFFEKVWPLYPEKKGKEKVAYKNKAVLFKLGYDVVKRCIDRYVADKPDWKAYQHGSTFFNGGYVDYLDGNYSPPARDYGKPEVYGSGRYDYDEIETMVRDRLNKGRV